jgi:hypothetical protein
VLQELRREKQDRAVRKRFDAVLKASACQGLFNSVRECAGSTLHIAKLLLGRFVSGPIFKKLTGNVECGKDRQLQLVRRSALAAHLRDGFVDVLGDALRCLAVNITPDGVFVPVW